jgi:hypothetical protein
MITHGYTGGKDAPIRVERTQGRCHLSRQIIQLRGLNPIHNARQYLLRENISLNRKSSRGFTNPLEHFVKRYNLARTVALRHSHTTGGILHSL